MLQTTTTNEPQTKAANFAGAQLSGANFAGANLTGACFAGANLTGADFSGAAFAKSTGITDSNGASPAMPKPMLSVANGNGNGATAIQGLSLNGLSMEVLSWQPRIFLYRNFLSEEECDYIINLATPRMKRSEVIDPNTGKDVEGWERTSKTSFLTEAQDLEDPTLLTIGERVAMATQFPLLNGAPLAVMHYGYEQKYEPHYDYFDPELPSAEKAFIPGGQRIATCLMYLHTPIKGGETIFPKVGISVPAIRGSAIVFHNCLPDGSVDPLTQHGSSPVIEGDKWVTTRWIYARTFNLLPRES